MSWQWQRPTDGQLKGGRRESDVETRSSVVHQITTHGPCVSIYYLHLSSFLSYWLGDGPPKTQSKEGVGDWTRLQRSVGCLVRFWSEKLTSPLSTDRTSLLHDQITSLYVGEPFSFCSSLRIVQSSSVRTVVTGVTGVYVSNYVAKRFRDSLVDMDETTELNRIYLRVAHSESVSVGRERTVSTSSWSGTLRDEEGSTSSRDLYTHHGLFPSTTIIPLVQRLWRPETHD